MEDAQKLMENLDDAKLVKHDSYHRTIHVWKGGHGVHVYDERGNETGFYNVGSFASDGVDRDLVEGAVKDKIRKAQPDEGGN